LTEAITAGRKTRYTTVAIVLHWLIAAAIVFQLMLGWKMEDLKGLQGYSAIQLHKSVGITILLLSLARLGWRLLHRAPPSPAHSPAWERFAAKAVHLGFYGVMIGMPLTGWVMVSASKLGIPTVLYGAVPWPHIPGLAHLPAGQKELIGGLADKAHWALALGAAALLLLHLGAVFKHQFIDRDEVLTHMAPGARPGRWAEPRLWGPVAAVVLIGALVTIVFAPRAAPPPAAEPAVVEAPAPTEEAPALAPPAAVAAAEATPLEPSHWAVQPGGTLAFQASWSGTPIDGAFKSWNADILFDPDALDRSKVTVSIDIASAATGDAQRDSSLPTADWFDAAAHPKATFTASRFRKTGTDRYVADGRLTLRGVSRPLSLPFTLKIDGDTARASGTATLDRTAFGVGQGSWAATDQIAGAVKVSFKLTAKRK
jgi:cytochrome b561/polyisoprenoid-binding protein YceI